MNDQIIAHLREDDNVPQILTDHLIGVSVLSEKFASKIGMAESGKLLGLLHDIGKASSEFQQYIKSATGMINPDEDEFIDPISKKGKIDHSSAGAQYIYKLLASTGNKGEMAGQILSLCLASHHSGLIDCISPDGIDKFTNRIEKEEELTHFKEAINNLPQEILKTINQLAHNEIIIDQIIKKIQEIKDPLDTKDTFSFKIGLLIRFLFSTLIDADRIDTADFEIPHQKSLRYQGEYPRWSNLIQKLNVAVEHYKNKPDQNNIDILRNQISEACYAFSTKPKGVFQLNVPTGGGKTISSLRFALNHANFHHLERIIYVIPYTSIIDQNASDIRNILEDTDPTNKNRKGIVFEHHSNLTPEKETYRHKVLAENWDAPIIFTTQVQFLETLFGSGTKSARRMHQLANAVIVFDEIQTLPIRCIHMFNVAIRFLVNQCGASVVLCTATQPLLHKIDPVSRSLPLDPQNKIIENEDEIYQAFKRVQVINHTKNGGWNEDAICDLVLKETGITGSSLVIVNTKKAARDLYFKLKGKKPVSLFHLSTNMCAAHRKDTLKTVKDQLAKQNSNSEIVCVSTQLIEAGVDVDFGAVIRYLAGLDSITQAAGRCNRSNKRENGLVHIINPANENIKNLYDISAAISITERLLDEYTKNPDDFDHDLIGLKLLERYYDYYFYRRKDEMGYKVGVNSIIGRDDELFNLLSINNNSIIEYNVKNNKTPSIKFTQSFQSANRSFRVIDTYTQGVIVPYNEGKEIILDLMGNIPLKKEYELLRKSQQYSINLFQHEFQKMVETNAIKEIKKGAGIYYLENGFYSNEVGFQPNTDVVNENLII